MEIQYEFIDEETQPPKRPRGRPRKPPEKRAFKRPTIYTEELANDICAWLSRGRTLTAYCERDGAPSYTTIMNWLWKGSKWYRDDFYQKYMEARKLQAECLADQVIDISDDKSDDFVTKTKPDGTEYEVFDTEHVQRSKLRIDARKWHAAKMHPKRFGDSSALKVTGDPKEPVTIKVVYEAQKKVPIEDMFGTGE